jgi:hypothetical protein
MPTAITNLRIAASGSPYHTGKRALGTPTCTANRPSLPTVTRRPANEPGAPARASPSTFTSKSPAAPTRAA